MKIYLADKEVIKEGWGVSVWVRAGPGKRKKRVCDRVRLAQL